MIPSLNTLLDLQQINMPMKYARVQLYLTCYHRHSMTTPSTTSSTCTVTNISYSQIQDPTRMLLKHTAQSTCTSDKIHGMKSLALENIDPAQSPRLLNFDLNIGGWALLMVMSSSLAPRILSIQSSHLVWSSLAASRIPQ